MCHQAIRDKKKPLSKEERGQSTTNRNREKTNKERETLSLILIEYHNAHTLSTDEETKIQVSYTRNRLRISRAHVGTRAHVIKYHARTRAQRERAYIRKQ